jgi:hypothetical protein
MRVFILCTGRNGSSTIIKACQHITNFTADHESLSRELGEARLNYPDNHIEADNRLSWVLGRLNERFGDEPFYVHLKRNRDQVAKSFTRRYFTPESMIDAFCEGIHKHPAELMSAEERLQAAYDYVDTIDSNIELFLADKSKVMTIEMEQIKTDFVRFWDQIGAEGDQEAALAEFDIRHNASKKRPLNYGYRLKLLFKREWQHLKMWV